MKMYFYRGRRPNFGDELNVWLWPRLLPGFFDDDERELFIGVGSTLFDFLPRESRKIVFGAGYGGYTAVPAIDERWRFYFVRGRLTAAALGLDAGLGVGDAAILVDPTRIDAIADGLRRILESDTLRNQLSAAGPRQAARFTWEKTASLTRDAYQSIV